MVGGDRLGRTNNASKSSSKTATIDAQIKQNNDMRKIIANRISAVVTEIEQLPSEPQLRYRLEELVRADIALEDVNRDRNREKLQRKLNQIQSMLNLQFRDRKNRIQKRMGELLSDAEK